MIRSDPCARDVSVTEFSAADHVHMAEALRLAERGLQTTSPNPRVGCVVTAADGERVGWGWHERAGEPHAEVHALRMAGERARGGTAYVTLEPCAHHGRTPPCADALLAAGVARVVVACGDSNPLVGGAGIARLRAAGVSVSVGLLQAPALALNAGFLRRIAGGRPWLRAKAAASLDGRTGMASGESRWITGPAARADVQQWRARSCAVLTGIGTVLADDPALDVRLPGTLRQPLRVVLDSRLRLPVQAQLLQKPGPVLVLTTATAASTEAAQHLRAAGAEVLAVALDDSGRPDWAAILAVLAARHCNEILLEAGATLMGSAFAAGVVDELLLYQAMTLLGSSARPLAQLPWSRMAEQQRFQLADLRQIGDDVRLRLLPGPQQRQGD